MPGPVVDPRAYDLRDRYHARFGGTLLPVPVESIAEDLLGLAVEEEPLAISGVLLPARRQIVLNAEESPARRRFTLAHELGHWVCQCQEETAAPIYCRAEDVSLAAQRALEREANVFAAELLMPAPAIRELWPAKQSLDALAAAFAVSDEAMGWRLFNLGLVSEKPTPAEEAGGVSEPDAGAD
jgi:predicted transcriptional regulator